MKTQQAAEREEQQRIKNLVLNYDLRDGEEQEGISPWVPMPNPNIHKKDVGLEKAAALNPVRLDKSGNNRSGQRARKLQLSDVDWYAPKPNFPHVEHTNVSPSMSPENTTPTPRPGNPSLRTGARSVGRLTRKAMLLEHESRNAALKIARKK